MSLRVGKCITQLQLWKWFKQDPIIHSVFLCFSIVLVVGLLFGFKILMNIFLFEGIDGQVLTYIRENTAQKIYQFKLTSNHLPKDLKEAEAKDHYCTLIWCYPIKYSAATDGQNFYVAAAGNYPFMAIFYSDYSSQRENKSYLGCCFSLALAEDYQGSRTDWPIYKRDPKIFATPSAWPKLREYSIMRFIPPFD